MNEYILKLSQ